MSKNAVGNDFYDVVVAKNQGVTKKDVRNLFIWYDLLSYVLPFQLIFITVHAIGSNNYPAMLLSILFIFVVDTTIKNSLKKDGTSYTRLSKHIPLVKLWAIPLVLMAIVTTVALVIVACGLV